MDHQAPWVPGETELVGKWHSQAMPGSRSMGGMRVRHPPRHLRHDHRYPRRDFIVKDQDLGMQLEDLHRSSVPALSKDDP
jgi:hypothetical protein